jgi:DNA-binding protein HU-beta
MNKSQLISAVATANNNMPIKDAKALVETFMTVFESALKSGEEVTLPGIGKLKVNVRPGRTGRNPKTGESIAIPEKRVVKFSPSSAFKNDVSTVPDAS